MTTTGVCTVNGVADARRMMTRDLIFVVGMVQHDGIHLFGLRYFFDHPGRLRGCAGDNPL